MESAIVIRPALSTVKAEPVLPPVIVKDTGVSPTVVTEPTEVPLPAVSETLKLWPNVIAREMSVTSIVIL